MLALAIAVVYKLRPDDTKLIDKTLDQAVCSGQVRDITKEEIRDSDGVMGSLLSNILDLLSLFVSFDVTLRDFIKEKKLNSDFFDVEKELHF